MNLQVVESQHGELLPLPGSQSSPVSTMPLPHIWREIVGTVESDECRHVVFISSIDAPTFSLHVSFVEEDVRREVVQMLPTEHWEKMFSPVLDTASMMNTPGELHWVVLAGQQGSVNVHPDPQSCYMKK